MHEWYVLHDAARNDVMRSAEKAAGRLRRPQLVHDHKRGEPCSLGQCVMVEPGEWPPTA